MTKKPKTKTTRTWDPSQVDVGGRLGSLTDEQMEIALEISAVHAAYYAEAAKEIREKVRAAVKKVYDTDDFDVLAYHTGNILACVIRDIAAEEDIAFNAYMDHVESFQWSDLCKLLPPPPASLNK